MNRDNQQLYRTYISCECNKRLYIGYTSKPSDSLYLGSFTDKTFHPTHKFDLYTSECKETALLMENQLQRAWQVNTNPRFANQVISGIKGFVIPVKITNEIRRKISKAKTGKKMSTETREKLSDLRSTPEYKQIMSIACKTGKNFDERKERLALYSRINSTKRSIKMFLDWIMDIKLPSRETRRKYKNLSTNEDKIGEVQRLEHRLVGLKSQLETLDNQNG